MNIKWALLCAALSVVLLGPAGAADCGMKGWFLSGSNTQDYACGSEEIAGQPGKSAFIKAKIAAPIGFATVMEQIDAVQYHGKRLRLTALIKTADAGKTQLWMRVDGPDNKILKFYNMDDRPVTGTADWKSYAVVLDVPPEAVVVSFGYFLDGKGEAWAKDFSLTPVGEDVPESVMPTFTPPKAPANLSFDQ
jgi:hypothetical protein